MSVFWCLICFTLMLSKAATSQNMELPDIERSELVSKVPCDEDNIFHHPAWTIALPNDPQISADIPSADTSADAKTCAYTEGTIVEVAQTDSNIMSHNCRFNQPPKTSSGGVFGGELRKGSKSPEVGQPSPVHNSVPLNSVELLKEPESGQGASIGHGDGSFDEVGHLGNVLARNIRRSPSPGAGSPSKGHNSVSELVASD